MRIPFLLCLLAATALAAAELPADLVAAAAPAGAVDVVAARKDAQPGQAVVVRGVVGGRAKPFVDGRALFTLVDNAIPRCDANPDDRCPTPWDYCCADRARLAASMATVQVVDADGRPIAAALEGVGGLKAGDVVVIAGTTAAGTSPSALIINATRLHVEPRPAPAPAK